MNKVLRKVAAGITALVMSVGMTSMVTSAEAEGAKSDVIGVATVGDLGIIGDVDMNGLVDFKDIVYIYQSVINKVAGLDKGELSLKQQLLADVNGDNMIEPFDGSCISRYFAMQSAYPEKTCTWHDLIPSISNNGVACSVTVGDVGIIGDVNMDGKVEPIDAAFIFRAVCNEVAGLDSGLTLKQQLLADVNGDGAMTYYDGMYILQYRAQMPYNTTLTWDDIIN